jgi:hypothetical protein
MITLSASAPIQQKKNRHIKKDTAALSGGSVEYQINQSRLVQARRRREAKPAMPSSAIAPGAGTTASRFVDGAVVVTVAPVTPSFTALVPFQKTLVLPGAMTK